MFFFSVIWVFLKFYFFLSIFNYFSQNNMRLLDHGLKNVVFLAQKKMMDDTGSNCL
jgi:hypothetical protein